MNYIVTTRDTRYNDDGSETETTSETEFASSKKAMDFLFVETGYNEVGVDTTIMEKRYGDGIFITGTTNVRHVITGLDFQTLRSYLDILAEDAKG